MTASVKSRVTDLIENPDNYTLAEWLAWMEAHHPRQIELGLDRIRAVAARLPLARERVKVITVGGTNGKGSCVEFLEQMLIAQGYRVGAYTSPHLLQYNERVRIDHNAVSDADLCAAFRAIYAVLGEISLSYFEFGTLAALYLFSQQPLDVWVLEVGLGGRLDAVNLIDTDAAILTTIDLDHQDWLGNDRETIGTEKAGIFRSQRWAICVDPRPPQTVLDGANKIGAKLLTLDAAIVVERSDDSWNWRAPALPAAPIYHNLPLPALPLPSAVAALAALHALQLPISEESVRNGLKRANLSGRFQRVERNGVEIIFDVAHNPQAAQWLAQRLRQLPAKRTRAVFEIMQDKDAEGIVSAVSAQIDEWFVGGLPDNPRAASPANLAALLNRYAPNQVYASTAIPDAFAAAMKAARVDERVVVFGSFFTVAAVMNSLAFKSTSN